MGRLIDLERERVEVLARELVPALRERGSLSAETAELADVERWRRAARRAGRLLGWRVRTGVMAEGSRVWAVSEDFPLSDEALRDAAERVAAAIDYGDAHTPPPWR